MTDDEITKLCKEAMELTPLDTCDEMGDDQWKPLYDDAQAMALVKRFRISISSVNSEYQTWTTGCGQRISGKSCSWSEDLNRAICETVAKMQKAKT